MKRFGAILRVGALVTILLASFGVQTTRAFDEDFYSGNDILYYDPTACGANAGGGGSVTLQGNDNLEKILRYLTGKGLSLAQASGAAGNFKAESGFDPAIIQGGGHAGPDYTPVNSVGFGIAQWTFTDRQKPLMDLAKSSNRKITDLDLQLDFVWQELTGSHKSTLDNLKNVSDAGQAAFVFHKYYEGSADTEAMIRNNRMAAASAIYDQYKGKITDGSGSIPSGSGGATSSPSPCAGQANNGQATNFAADGFAIYNQYDPKWANNAYGSSTIGESGCGPSSMAMIITALTGKTVTPADTVSYANTKGLYIPGQGSSWSVAPVLAEHWGLKAHNISGSVAAVNQVLSSGGLVITSGQGATPFTSGGHYITIRGVTSSGKWKIGDSNGQVGIANSNKEWDPQYILDIANKGNIVAITK